MAVAGTAFVRDAIAYRSYGNGPPTVVINWGWFSNIETFHEISGYTAFLDRLASSSRVVTFDVRGMGASRGSLGPFEDRVDDLSDVVDELGSEPVIVFGASSGGAVAIAFATRRPKVVQKLILYGAYPRLVASDDLPHMASPELLEQIRAALGRWGSGRTVPALAPSLAVTREGRELWAAIERSCVDQSQALASFAVDESIDVVPLLADVTAPTLVMHRVNEQFSPPQSARFLASRISGAELVHLDGLDHYPWLSNADAVAAAIEAFIDELPVRAPTLKSVLITDIAGSTKHLLRVGEHRWNEVMHQHDAVTRRTVDACNGRLVKSTGDGALAIFDQTADALRCAVTLREALGELDLTIRCGVTVGDVIPRGYDVTGMSVHIAERIAKLAGPGQIFVSRGVTVLLSESRFEWLGTRRFRGVPADRSVFELR